MFLISQEQIAIILLVVCVLPIFVLIILAIIRTISTRTDSERKHLENISHEEKDLTQQQIFYDSYGGKDNIVNITLEMSRITVSVSDIEKVDTEKLKELGAKGVLLVDKDVKCSFGDRAKYIYELLK